MGLIYFEGGPLDSYVQETSVLLGRESIGLPLIDGETGEPIYVWTDRTITGSSGQVARVWRHKGSDATTRQTQQPPVPQATTVETATGELREAVDAATPPREPSSESDGTTQPGTANAPAQDDVGSYSGASDLNGATLMARRKALKLGRATVAEKTGLAHSKIFNIENNSGKRITEEERRRFADALTAFETEKGVGGGAGARE